MRLPTINTRAYDQLEELRPKIGDTVLYGDELFVIEQAGMRYYVAHLASDPKIVRWLKHLEVCKWIPTSPDEMQDHEMKTPLLLRDSSR